MAAILPLCHMSHKPCIMPFLVNAFIAPRSLMPQYEIKSSLREIRVWPLASVNRPIILQPMYP